MSRSVRARRARRRRSASPSSTRSCRWCPTLGAADNLFLGRWPAGPLGLVRGREQRAAAMRALERFGLDVDPDRPVGELSPAVRQLIEIAKALDRDARVIVMDEPTARSPAPTSRSSTRGSTSSRARLRRDLHHAPHGGDRARRRPHHRAARRHGASARRRRAKCRRRSSCAGWADATRPSPIGAPRRRPRSSPARPDRAARRRASRSSRAAGSSSTRSSLDVRPGRDRRPRRPPGIGRERAPARHSSARWAAPSDDAPAARRRRGRDPLRRATPSRAAWRSSPTIARRPASCCRSRSPPTSRCPSLERLSPLGWRRPAREEAALAEELMREPRASAPRRRSSPWASSRAATSRRWRSASGCRSSRACCCSTSPRAASTSAPSARSTSSSTGSPRAASRILVASSDLPELLALSDRVVVLHRGRVTARLARGEATPDTVLEAAMGDARVEATRQ